VDVVLTHTLPAAPGAQSRGLVSDVVLQNVRILGMDLNADPTSTTVAAAHTATLEVSVLDAEKLALAAQSGSLSLALRRTGNAEVDPVRTFAIDDLGPAGPRAARGAPGGGTLIAAAQRRSPRPRPSDLIIRTRSVVVVHGDASSSVEVPAERFGAGA
jgi:pilus assembly protein CpaB